MAAGFSLSRTQNSSEFVGKTELYAVLNPHTILARGDAVIIEGNADANGRSAVLPATAGANRITGIVESIAPDLANEDLNDAGGLAADVPGNVQLVTEQAAVFEVDVKTGETFVLANVGNNVAMDIVAATKTGGLTIANTTITTAGQGVGTTLPFRLLRLLRDKATNTLGKRVLVRLNASTASTGAAGV